MAETSVDRQEWFDANKTLLETAYLKGHQPWQQSGFGLYSNRTAEQWEGYRRPVADCITSSGTFLDIGCANGYLLECVIEWTKERGIETIPYGLDISERLAVLAQERLSQCAGHIFVGNAWHWTPPRRFSYARTELVYVPDDLHSMFVTRLLDHYLEHDGKLLVAEYRGRDKETPRLTVDSYLVELGFSVESVKIGYWNGVEQTRIAVVRKPLLA